MLRILTIQISTSEVRKLLQMEENHFVDLKSTRISPAKLTKAIAVFANAEGGELFIGVEDSPRNWEGFANVEAGNSHLQVFENLFPLGADYDYQFLSAENQNGSVLKVAIAKTRDIVKASDGKVYVRRGGDSRRQMGTRHGQANRSVANTQSG